MMVVSRGFVCLRDGGPQKQLLISTLLSTHILAPAARLFVAVLLGRAQAL